jgi:hypothetical protein
MHDVFFFDSSENGATVCTDARCEAASRFVNNWFAEV